MIGTDVIEIERIEEAAKKASFFTGVFTEAERAYYASHGSRAQTLAGLFCAKEAVAKALGCGFRGFRPCDIEIEHDALGAPQVNLLGAAKEKFPHTRLCVSISHCQTYATAVAMVLSSVGEKEHG